MPAAGAPVTLYGLISTVYVNRNECVNTLWDPDWASVVDDGYFLVYDPPVACPNTAGLGDGQITVPQAVKDYVAANTNSGVWGSITGTLSAQTDLAAALSGKAATTYVDTAIDASIVYAIAL